MNIAVCIKQAAGRGNSTDPRTGLLRRGGDAQLNPYDRYALEAALTLRAKAGGTVTALTMGPDSARQVLRDAASMGADRLVLLCDPAFAGADVYATALALAMAIRRLGGFDLILCGRQTTDGDTAQVPPSLAAHLGLPFCTWVDDISWESGQVLTHQQLTGGSQSVRLTLPALLSVTENIGTPRLPGLRQSLAALSAPVQVITATELDPAGIFGQAASHTRVVKVYSAQPAVKSPPVPCTPMEAAELIRAQFPEVGS